MGKTEVENFYLKSKLNIVSGIIANAKTEIKSDCAMSQNGLNPLNNEFSE